MITLSKDKRDRIAAAKAEIAEILKPETQAQRKARRAAAKARAKAVDRTRPEQRQPRVKDNTYLAWIRRLPCVACGSFERVQAAHIRAGYPTAGWRSTGMQEKPDDIRTAPLCVQCHLDGPKAQHKANERGWWADLGIDPPDLCRALRAAFEADQDGSVVVRRFTPSRPLSNRRASA